LSDSNFKPACVSVVNQPCVLRAKKYESSPCWLACVLRRSVSEVLVRPAASNLRLNHRSGRPAPPASQLLPPPPASTPGWLAAVGWWLCSPRTVRAATRAARAAAWLAACASPPLLFPGRSSSSPPPRPGRTGRQSTSQQWPLHRAWLEAVVRFGATTGGSPAAQSALTELTPLLYLNESATKAVSPGYSSHCWR
jgi:hypothetical protein